MEWDRAVNKSTGLVEGPRGGPRRSGQSGQFLSVPGQLHRVSRTQSSSRGEPCHVDRASQKEMAGELRRGWLLFHSDALVQFLFTVTLILPPWLEGEAEVFHDLFSSFFFPSKSESKEECGSGMSLKAELTSWWMGLAFILQSLPTLGPDLSMEIVEYDNLLYFNNSFPWRLSPL